MLKELVTNCKQLLKKIDALTSDITQKPWGFFISIRPKATYIKHIPN